MTKNNKEDIKFVEALAHLLNKKELGEIEVARHYGENDALEVRLVKHSPQPIAPVVAAPAQVASIAQAEQPSGRQTIDSTPDAGSASNTTLENAETSPMVGTVYLAPEPGADPFVSVGDSVEVGQTLLIIEAMKTMNQIPATKAGKITRIVVEDASPVEFGAPLVVIE